MQLWRAANLDRDGALAYKWRTTNIRARTRRSWSEGVLLADPTEGVVRVAPDGDGFASAAAVLADVRQIATSTSLNPSTPLPTCPDIDANETSDTA